MGINSIPERTAYFTKDNKCSVGDGIQQGLEDMPVRPREKFGSDLSQSSPPRQLVSS
jgi:hypothetical protein